MAQMVFCTWVLKTSNHLIHFSLRNGKLNVKKTMPRNMIEKHRSPRNKITRRFRDLISREFSACSCNYSFNQMFWVAHIVFKDFNTNFTHIFGSNYPRKLFRFYFFSITWRRAASACFDTIKCTSNITRYDRQICNVTLFISSGLWSTFTPR